MKHPGQLRRLTRMHAQIRSITFTALRSVSLVALAMALILVVLPAVLSVQAATN